MPPRWPGLILVALPSAIYLMFGLSYFLRGRSRREHVVRLFRNPKIWLFYKTAYGIKTSDPNVMAAELLPRWTQHLVPLVLCAVIILPVSVTAASAGGFFIGLPDPTASRLAGVPHPVLAGFAGAYIWGLWACIERFRVLNWTPGFIHGLWVRTLLGGALGCLVPVRSDEAWLTAPLLAFGLGAFPVATLRKWLRRTVAKAVGMGDEDEGAGPRWSVIQGVTPELLDRLEEADVASPTGLANADPFQLFLRTNIIWRHILDLIDQAILAQYVGEKIRAVRSAGIRGSIEAALVAQRLLPPNEGDDPPDPSVVESAGVTNERVSFVLDQAPQVTRNLLQNLYEDAQVKLISDLWFEENGKGVRSAAPAERDGSVRVHGAEVIKLGEKKEPPPGQGPPSFDPPLKQPSS